MSSSTNVEIFEENNSSSAAKVEVNRNYDDSEVDDREDTEDSNAWTDNSSENSRTSAGGGESNESSEYGTEEKRSRNRYYDEEDLSKKRSKQMDSTSACALQEQDPKDSDASFKHQLSSLCEDEGHLVMIPMGSDPHPFNDRIIGDSNVKLPEVMASAVQLLISRIEKAESAVMYIKDPQSNRSFCLTNALAPGNPIVYASRSFLQLSGYEPDDVLGKTCCFLQGSDTNRAQVQAIEKAYTEGKEIKLVVKNYKADGSSFWNYFQMSPLMDQGRVLLFLLIQQQVSGPAFSPERDIISTSITE